MIEIDAMWNNYEYLTNLRSASEKSVPQTRRVPLALQNSSRVRTDALYDTALR